MINITIIFHIKKKEKRASTIFAIANESCKIFSLNTCHGQFVATNQNELTNTHKCAHILLNVTVTRVTFERKLKLKNFFFISLESLRFYLFLFFFSFTTAITQDTPCGRTLKLINNKQMDLGFGQHGVSCRNYFACYLCNRHYPTVY